MTESGKKWDPRYRMWVDEYEPFDSDNRTFVRRLVGWWVLLGILFVVGMVMVFARPGPDRGEPLSSPVAASPVPGTSAEQSLTAAAADFIAHNPYSEENNARLRLILETSGCEVAGMSLLPGVNRKPLADGVYQEVRRFGPEYTESAGEPFTLLLKASCPDR